MCWGGDKQAEGVLKKLTTEPYMTIELKGVDPAKVRNCGNTIIPSNEEWIVPVSQKGRRTQALEPDAELAGIKTAATRAIINEILATNILSIARHLYELDIAEFDPTEVVVTDLLRDQKVESMNPMHKMCYEILNSGVVKFEGVKFQVSGNEFKCDIFYEATGDKIKFMTQTKWWKELKKLWPSLVRERLMKGGCREWYVTFPDIKTMRADFCQMYNDSEWEFEDAEEIPEAQDDLADV
jgi:hypothetical protein